MIIKAASAAAIKHTRASTTPSEPASASASTQQPGGAGNGSKQRSGGRQTMGQQRRLDTNEHLALVRFANRLGSAISNSDAGLSDEGDVRREARLLMSLSASGRDGTAVAAGCDSPSTLPHKPSASGRSTPDTDAGNNSSSGYSSSSSHSTFSFTCPSLSLSSLGRSTAPDTPSDLSMRTDVPAELLKRPLTVEDRDALRLSARAMTHNVMRSYQRGTQWRIQSWLGMLSRRLAEEERRLEQANARQQEIRALLDTSEARIILHLQDLINTLKVSEVSNSFNVQERVEVQKPASSEPPHKRRKLPCDDVSPDNDATAMGETEYYYDVAHALVMECTLNVLTPAGNARIELQLPGTIVGTFMSEESGHADLVAVNIDLDTAILASMIERSCRKVVRASVEAMLRNESVALSSVPDAAAVDADTSAKAPAAAAETARARRKPRSKTKKAATSTLKMGRGPTASPTAVTEVTLKPPVGTLPAEARAATPVVSKTAPTASTARTATPLRSDASLDRIQMGTIVTPRDLSSPIYATDSDSEDRPVMLAIPSDFSNKNVKQSLRMISPHPQRRWRTAGAPLPKTMRLCPAASSSSQAQSSSSSSPLPQLVSPQPQASKAIHPGSSDGPDLPTLVEVACAAMINK